MWDINFNGCVCVFTFATFHLNHVGYKEVVLKPIIELIQEGNSYEKVMEKLVETFPDMDTENVEEMLARAIFVSEAWGMLNAQIN